MTTYNFRHIPVPAHRHCNPDGSEGGWIAETAQVDNTAYIGEQAQIYGNARIYGHAQVSEGARVYGHAQVFGDARIYGHAKIYGRAQIYGRAKIYGRANVLHNAKVSNHVVISEDDRVSRTPLVINGLEYPITVTDRHIRIGCTRLTFDEARHYTIARARKEQGAHAAEFVRVTKSLLMSFVRYAKSR